MSFAVYGWALKQAGVDAELILIPGAGHGPRPGGWLDVNRLIFEFLRKRGVMGPNSETRIPEARIKSE